MKKILSLAILVILFSTARGMQPKPYFFDRNAADQNFQRARQARVQPAATVIEEPEESTDDDNWRDSDIYGICDDIAGDGVNEQDVIYMFNNNPYSNLQDAENAWAVYLTRNLGLNENVEKYNDSEINLLWYFLSNFEEAVRNNDQESANNLNAMLANFSMGVQNVLAVWDVAQGQQLNQNIPQVPSVEEVMIDLCQLVEVEYKKITRMHSDQLAALTYELIGEGE